MVTISGPPTQSAVDQVLTTTRCVRKGLDMTREVPRELIEECLRVAMQAPIGSNGLYPHFVVVTDPARTIRGRRMFGFTSGGAGTRKGPRSALRRYSATSSRFIGTRPASGTRGRR